MGVGLESEALSKNLGVQREEKIKGIYKGNNSRALESNFPKALSNFRISIPLFCDCASLMGPDASGAPYLGDRPQRGHFG